MLRLFLPAATRSWIIDAASAVTVAGVLTVVLTALTALTKWSSQVNATPAACSFKRAVTCLGWVFHHTYASWVVHRTCGEPDEIGLTPMGVELNGP